MGKSSLLLLVAEAEGGLVSRGSVGGAVEGSAGRARRRNTNYRLWSLRLPRIQNIWTPGSKKTRGQVNSGPSILWSVSGMRFLSIFSLFLVLLSLERPSIFILVKMYPSVSVLIDVTLVTRFAYIPVHVSCIYIRSPALVHF